MDADREREIRELAERLLVSKRHRRIGIVLTDMLAEIDLLRARSERSERDDGEQRELRWDAGTHLAISGYGLLAEHCICPDRDTRPANCPLHGDTAWRPALSS